MVSGSYDYKESVLNDLHDYSDLGSMKHAFYIERQLIRSASPDELHPNPNDEFSDPAIGPSDRIVGEYKALYTRWSLVSSHAETFHNYRNELAAIPAGMKKGLSH